MTLEISLQGHSRVILILSWLPKFVRLSYNILQRKLFVPISLEIGLRKILKCFFRSITNTNHTWTGMGAQDQ